MEQIVFQYARMVRSHTGRSAVWLARLPWEQEVDGSNPFAPIFPTCFISRRLNNSLSIQPRRLLRTRRVQLSADALNGLAQIGWNDFRVDPLIDLFTVAHQRPPHLRANAPSIGPGGPGASEGQPCRHRQVQEPASRFYMVTQDSGVISGNSLSSGQNEIFWLAILRF